MEKKRNIDKCAIHSSEMNEHVMSKQKKTARMKVRNSHNERPRFFLFFSSFVRLDEGDRYVQIVSVEDFPSLFLSPFFVFVRGTNDEFLTPKIRTTDGLDGGMDEVWWCWCMNKHLSQCQCQEQKAKPREMNQVNANYFPFSPLHATSESGRPACSREGQ